MRAAPCYIQNYQRVIDAYGYWPSFHDSPVLRFTVDSEAIELDVDVWEMTAEVDAKGFFVLTKRHHIGFRFTGLVSADLDEFLPENILAGLRFSSEAELHSQGYFSLGLDSAMGSDLCGRVSATSGEITFVTPSPD